MILIQRRWVELAVLLVLAPVAMGDVASLRDRYPKAAAELVTRAERAATEALVTVMDKPAPPPGGTLHDYWSQAPYWWPNPDSPDGLPYVNRDGEVNPESESDKFDRLRYFKMGDVIRHSAMAYRLTGEERFAETAARWARAWFVNPDTRMMPGFRFAQSIPGQAEGSPIGIIRGMTLLEVDDALRCLTGSRHWSDVDAAAWGFWKHDYLNWLLTSELGQLEDKAFNNHGTWYDVQVVTFGLASNRRDMARERLENAKTGRIQRQIRPDGKMPLELGRTKSWDYSVMNALAMARLADLGQRVDVDLWGFETKFGSSIVKAIEYLVPYALGEANWEEKQIKDFDGQSLYPVVRAAADATGNPSLKSALEKLGQDSMIVLTEELRLMK